MKKDPWNLSNDSFYESKKSTSQCLSLSMNSVLQVQIIILISWSSSGCCSIRLLRWNFIQCSSQLVWRSKNFKTSTDPHFVDTNMVPCPSLVFTKWSVSLNTYEKSQFLIIRSSSCLSHLFKERNSANRKERPLVVVRCSSWENLMIYQLWMVILS